MADKKAINLREEIMREKKKTRAEEVRKIEEIYNEGPTLKIINSFESSGHKNFFSGKILFLIIFSAVFIVFGFFFYQDSYQPRKEESGRVWYSVKLIDGEIYYGQIEDTASDPVVMKNVYYNYDQIKEGEKTASETGNIRLVKRGQETHGPDGSMDIVRSQVIFMEPLGRDSKVLKAILEYEKK